MFYSSQCRVLGSLFQKKNEVKITSISQFFSHSHQPPKMLLVQLYSASYCLGLSSTSSSLGFKCRKKKWTDFNIIFAPTLPVPLPQEAHCRFLSAIWWPSPFVPYTCPSTPWWHGAPPKHGLGLRAQEPQLYEAAQAGCPADVPPNPTAPSLWPMCAASKTFQVPFSWPSIIHCSVSMRRWGQVGGAWMWTQGAFWRHPSRKSI